MEIIVIDLRELKKLEILSFNPSSAIEHRSKKNYGKIRSIKHRLRAAESFGLKTDHFQLVEGSIG